MKLFHACLATPLLLLLTAGCVADGSNLDDDDLATTSSELGNDTNAKLLSTAAAGAGSPLALTQVGAWQDWAKTYHRAVALDATRVAFYDRTTGKVRVMALTSTGAATIAASGYVPAGYDEVLPGEFAGSKARRDLAFYRRDTGAVMLYEVTATGGLAWLETHVVAPTSNGGRWDLITSGYLGQADGRDDLLVYNKAEGKARIYRHLTSGSGFVVAEDYTGWRRNWDHIVPGRIDADVLTDFAFYNQDGGGVVGTQDLVTSSNPLNGHVKFLSFANLAAPALISERFDHWPMAAHVTVVPGQFGGNDRTDFLVYEGDPDGTSRATYWINNGAGQYSSLGTDTTWQGRWTTIAPMQVNGGTTDLFFYTRQQEVKLLVVVDQDGVGGIVDSDATIRTDVVDWMRLVNRAYAPAGVHFAVASTVEHFDMDDVGGVDATSPTNAAGSYTNCYAPDARDALNDLAASFGATYPGHLVVYVRARGAGGCSSSSADFAVMPAPSSTGKAVYTRASNSAMNVATNAKLFAHELGHFFGLGHSQPESVLAAQADRYAYDLDEGKVRDTPPNPTNATPAWAALANPCDDSGNNDLVISGAGFSYTLNPERHEIMSKGSFANCDQLYRVTPDQSQVIHTVLYERAWLLAE